MDNFRARVTVAILTVVLLVIVVHRIGWLKSLENRLRQIINPSSAIVYNWAVDIDGKKKFIDNPSRLYEIYKLKESEIYSLQTLAAKSKLLEEENSELRNQLNYFIQSKLRHIGADVIGKNIEPLTNTLLINRGFEHGVKVGDPVVVGGGVMVGRIARTEQRTSVVRLLKDQKSSVAATVLNSSRSIGLVEGGYGLSVRMNFIPQSEDVRGGDEVITSGLEEQIPRGLLIGTITTIEKELYQPFQKAVLSPAVDLDQLTVVSVLTSVTE
jgi:rod shape-determining protein MreC